MKRYAVIKKNIVKNILTFLEEDSSKKQKALEKLDYDKVIDLKDKEAHLGDAWDGKKIIPRPFKSWVLDKNFNWKAPIPNPFEKGEWDENLQTWLPYIEKTEWDSDLKIYIPKNALEQIKKEEGLKNG